MATNLYQGYESTKRVRLPEGKTSIDTKNPLGAAVMAALIRANNTGNFENVGNALALNDAVTTVGNNTDPIVVDTLEVSVLIDKDGIKHELTNPRTIEVYCREGCKIVATKIREVTSGQYDMNVRVSVIACPYYYINMFIVSTA